MKKTLFFTIILFGGVAAFYVYSMKALDAPETEPSVQTETKTDNVVPPMPQPPQPVAESATSQDQTEAQPMQQGLEIEQPQKQDDDAQDLILDMPMPEEASTSDMPIDIGPEQQMSMDENAPTTTEDNSVGSVVNELGADNEYDVPEIEDMPDYADYL